MEGHNMRLTSEEQQLFHKYLAQEAEGKRLITEAEEELKAAEETYESAVESTEEKRLQGRLMELEAYWLQGQAIRRATQTFCKNNGKPCAVAHVAGLFDKQVRMAQTLVKFFESVPEEKRDAKGDHRVFLEAKWTEAKGHKKEAKQRAAKAAFKAIVKDEAETVALLADEILSSGKARQYAAIAETAERGEEAEASMAQEKVAKAAEEHSVEPEVFIAAARKAGEVVEADKRKKSEREERRKLRSAVAAQYDTLSKADFIDWIVANIKELGEL